MVKDASDKGRDRAAESRVRMNRNGGGRDGERKAVLWIRIKNVVAVGQGKLEINKHILEGGIYERVRCDGETRERENKLGMKVGDVLKIRKLE
jgi:hypothetical protein